MDKGNKINILIITQKVDKDDPILGFFHNWLNRISSNSKKVIVICLEKGNYELPENVEVLSLGKEKEQNRFKYIFNFYKLIFKKRNEYQSVLVHMNPIYIILGWIFWKFKGKKIGIWYAHKSVDLKLRISTFLVDIIFSPSASSFRLKSSKLHITGHGIDVEKFKPNLNIKNKKDFLILSTGRISRIKNYETLIRVVGFLREKGLNVKCNIIGEVKTSDQGKYLEELKNLIESLNIKEWVSLSGSISNDKISDEINKASLFVNTSHTGSLDKAVLESLSCGIPAISCNESFFSILNQYELYFKKNDYIDLGMKIENFINKENKDKISKDLRNYVVENHNLNNLIPRIINLLK